MANDVGNTSQLSTNAEDCEDASRRNLLLAGTAFASLSLAGVSVRGQQAQAQQTPPAGAGARKPNILVIFGDDIGISNISAYSDGLMGYETPNIDRIGKEGLRFLQYYG